MVVRLLLCLVPIKDGGVGRVPGGCAIAPHRHRGRYGGVGIERRDHVLQEG